MEQHISVIIAFFSGLVSFFSPCILPLIPVYLCFITGLSIDELKNLGENRNAPKKALKEIILFILGFSIVFVSLGASAGPVGNFLIKSQKILRIVGGVVIIIFGLHIVGLFKIKYLEYEKKIHLKNKPMLGGFGSFIIGITFAIGWTPCIGPILGSILTLAATKKTLSQGVLLLSSYSLGLGLPFLITGLAVSKIMKLFTKLGKYLRIISLSTGILLIVVGVLVLFGRIL
ncbi:MAG TPA: cytochrome C biogenesis protein [Elusimicrobia bacterium]|nr:cytochrome C biogenesis protein [Elusimicrobiota bacterium]